MVQNVDMTGNSQLVTFGGGTIPNYGSYNPTGFKTTTTIATGNTMADSGTLNLQMNATGLTVSGAGLSSTSVDIAVAVYQMPAFTLDQFGRGINIVAGGSVATTAATAKRFKIFVSNNTLTVGSIVTSTAAVVTIADSSAVSVTTGTGWEATANIFKTGGQSSNTQLAIHESTQVGLTPAPLLAPTSLTLTESSPIFVAVTMNEATVGNTLFNFLQVVGYN